MSSISKSKGLTRKDLPDVGDRRFFSIIHNPKSEKQPVRVELRESFSSDTKLVSMSHLVGFANTIADKESIQRTCEEIVARVGKVDEFVGVVVE